MSLSETIGPLEMLSGGGNVYPTECFKALVGEENKAIDDGALQVQQAF